MRGLSDSIVSISLGALNNVPANRFACFCCSPPKITGGQILISKRGRSRQLTLLPHPGHNEDRYWHFKIQPSTGYLKYQWL